MPFRQPHAARSFLVAIAALLAIGSSGRLACAADDAPIYHRPVVISFEGMIDQNLKGYFDRKLEEARSLEADLVIVEIDSPGGLIDESFQIGQALAEVDWAHTVAYVPKNAYSGAAVAALGCDDILLHPKAHLGDVGVIFYDVEYQAFRYVEEKATSPWVLKLRSLAAAKKRSPALAEAMMRLDTQVFEYKHETTGETRYLTEADARDAGDAWKKGKLVTETDPDRKLFFTVDGTRGSELGLVDATVNSRDEAIARYGASMDETVVLRWSSVDTAVMILNNPFVTGLLFIVGLVCLYIEFSAPGVGIGGLAAGLCFALFFWSRFLGGTAELLELTLFLAGIAFFAAEIFVFPGFGISGLTGLLLIGSSIVLAGQSFVIPRSPEQWETLGTSLTVTTISSFLAIVAAAFLSRYFRFVPMFGRIALAPPSPSAESQSTDHAAAPVSVGDRGVADSHLRPSGKARFGDRLLNVVADASFIERGAAVEAVEVSPTRIVVREIAADGDADANE